MISTKNLNGIPSIDELKRICQSIAILDAILQPEWDLRYFSFNCNWHLDEMMASMRDSSGDEYFILFNNNGCIILGHTPHSPVGVMINRTGKPLPGVIDQVPKEFMSALAEPAFSGQLTTFCIWRNYTDPKWNIGNAFSLEGDDPDGSEGVLFMLDGNPKIYQDWCEEYYEVSVPLKAIEMIYQHIPLTKKIIKQINQEMSIDDLSEDIADIGYPLKQ